MSASTALVLDSETPTAGPELGSMDGSLSADLEEWKNTIDGYSSMIEAERDIFRRICESYKSLEAQLYETQGANEILKKEVDIWKRAYSEEARKVHKAEDRVELLEAQFTHTLTKDRESTVLVLIDGDGYIFNDDLLQRGREGGLEAAQILNESIINHVNASFNQVSSPKLDKSWVNTPPGQVQVWTYMFFNLKGLKQAVVSAGICSVDEFEGFMVGFNQANPRLAINDVHSGKEAADAKIKAYLQSWIQFPQTSKIYFGGAHDNGYYPTLAELYNNNLLDRLVLLQGYEQIAHEIASLHLPVLNIDGLFRTEKIPTAVKINYHAQHYARSSTSVSSIPPTPSIASNNDRMTPSLNVAAAEYYPIAQAVAPADSLHDQTAKQINPDLKLNKQAGHLEILRQNARNIPCPAFNSEDMHS